MELQGLLQPVLILWESSEAGAKQGQEPDVGIGQGSLRTELLTFGVAAKGPNLGSDGTTYILNNEV